VPFRQAHDAVGKILQEAERQKKVWTELPLDELRKISSAFDSDFSKGLTVEAALAGKKVPGGTSIESVRTAIADLENRLPKEACAK
jgi:argininosuccinate lyase